MKTHRKVQAIVLGLIVSFVARAAATGVGDPQFRTDHLWYPGELACSTFERLAKTQAALYQRVVGAMPKTAEQRVLAAWSRRILSTAKVAGPLHGSAKLDGPVHRTYAQIRVGQGQPSQ